MSMLTSSFFVSRRAWRETVVAFCCTQKKQIAGGNFPLGIHPGLAAYVDMGMETGVVTVNVHMRCIFCIAKKSLAFSLSYYVFSFFCVAASSLQSSLKVSIRHGRDALVATLQQFGPRDLTGAGAGACNSPPFFVFGHPLPKYGPHEKERWLLRVALGC